MDKEGIPQGGIDSPYLWNIYMLEFDRFVTNYMHKLMHSKNQKLKTGKYEKKADGNLSIDKSKRNRNFTETYESGRVLRRNLTKKLKKFKMNHVNAREWNNISKQIPVSKHTAYTPVNIRFAKYELIKQVRLLRHKRNNESTSIPKTYNLKYYYTRCPTGMPVGHALRAAHDWILLGNFGKELATRIQNHIKDFLEKELYATLSLEKTLITNIKKEPARFLGFEFYVRDTYKVNKVFRDKTNPQWIKTYYDY